MLPSPNFDDRPDSAVIDTLVFHYTGMKSAEEALARLCDPAAKVSAHYMIDEAGEITPLVAEEKRAWHAGVSHWAGRDSVNDVSIGIELVNPGHEFGYEPFTDRQLDSLMLLSHELLERWPIEARNVVGHSDIAPSRKEDPGEFFPWELMALDNIGLWPDLPGEAPEDEVLAKPGDEGGIVSEFQDKLTRYGYGVKVDGNYSLQTSYVVKAFQRHFMPARLGEPWSEIEMLFISQLLEQL